jgi:hypothetical protein
MTGNDSGQKSAGNFSLRHALIVTLNELAREI